MTAYSSPVALDDEGALDGQIVVLLPETAAARAAVALVRNKADELRSAHTAQRNGDLFTPPTLPEWQALESELTGRAIFACRFRMLRNGKCFFESCSSSPPDPISLRWMISQSYYYLKDAVHQHYHHRTSTDAIIEVVDPTQAPGWRTRTLRNLYRKVISLRRSISPNRLSDSLGVLAYARVFREIFGERDYSYDGVVSTVAALPEYANDLNASIDIRKETAQRRADRRGTEVQFFIGSGLALIALFVGLNDQFSPTSIARKTLDVTAAVVGDNPLVFVGPVLVLFFAASFYTGMHDPADIPAVRRFYRLFAWLGRGWLVGLLAFIAAGAAAAAIYVVSLAIGGGHTGAPNAKPLPNGTASVAGEETKKRPPAIVGRGTPSEPRR